MNIHPIQGYNSLTKPKKIAAVAGVAVGVAAAATTAVAFSQGKKADVKGMEAIKKGYGIIFEALKKGAATFANTVASHLPKKGGEAAEKIAHQG